MTQVAKIVSIFPKKIANPVTRLINFVTVCSCVVCLFEMDMYRIKDDANQLDAKKRTNNSVLEELQATSSLGRSQEKETAILWPRRLGDVVASCTYPTCRHRQEQTPRKTTETLDRRHQTTDHRCTSCTVCPTCDRQIRVQIHP